MIDQTADEWMEQVMNQLHGSAVPAQDFVMIDEGDGKIMTKTEIQAPRKKGAAWSRMSFRIDLERAHRDMVERVGTDAKLYALFCIGVDVSDLVAEAHLKWEDAPRDSEGMSKAILRGRGEWDMRLRKLGIYASTDEEEKI